MEKQPTSPLVRKSGTRSSRLLRVFVASTPKTRGGGGGHRFKRVVCCGAPIRILVGAFLAQGDWGVLRCPLEGVPLGCSNPKREERCDRLLTMEVHISQTQSDHTPRQKMTDFGNPPNNYDQGIRIPFRPDYSYPPDGKAKRTVFVSSGRR